MKMFQTCQPRRSAATLIVSFDGSSGKSRALGGSRSQIVESVLDPHDHSFSDAKHAATRPLRIAQIAPLYESVPPVLYGGTERVVAYLSDALIALGHDVTLFASGESTTRARLAAGRTRAIRL